MHIIYKQIRLDKYNTLFTKNRGLIQDYYMDNVQTVSTNHKTCNDVWKGVL